MRKSSTLPALDSSLDLPETEARFQYLILSQRRTGSSMLSSSLEKTGVAGVPREYFNDTSLKTLSQPVTMPDLQEYFVGIRSRRTTKNGVFGMKVHFEHFQKLFLDGNRISQAGIGFLKSFSRIIVISRRDKIAQAISRLAASRNKIWNSREESDEGLHNHEFRKEDTPEILKYLHQACEEERR